MNKVLYVFLMCFLLCAVSCKSKKKVVAQKTKPKTEKKSTRKPKPKPEPTKEITKPVVVPENLSYTERVKFYIATYEDIAKEEMRVYGIPASITLAQGILESGAGRGELSLRANNHFGIKCHKTWKGERVYHDDDELQECFRKYKNPENSFKDHSLFLTQRSRYKSLFSLKKDDYKGWAKGLKKAGYATDPKYPNKLIRIIETYNLDQYDREVLGKKSKKKKNSPKDDRPSYTVKKGDTLYSISRKFNLSVADLKAYNNLNSNTLSIGQVLFLSR